MRSTGLGLVLCVFMGGCSNRPQPMQVCTLIGCESGLEVQLVDQPPGTYRIEASAPGQPAPRVVECTTATPCGPSVFLRDFTPESATIRVIVGADTTARTVQPSYETVQPNGPGCPPTCRQARVQIDLES